ncbi:hypothetical protein EVAR_4638_1 [Eumeta japonica]|uniref:Uncharacterized protein n=1 Tax=Eumeta variegata TaxID=151549 RepID=A0A4C1SX72_EUMVA|nr:hypothetical protein EVAR_4638_1 [Eumeta japonica]
MCVYGIRVLKSEFYFYDEYVHERSEINYKRSNGSVKQTSGGSSCAGVLSLSMRIDSRVLDTDRHSKAPPLDNYRQLGHARRITTAATDGAVKT